MLQLINASQHKKNSYQNDTFRSGLKWGYWVESCKQTLTVQHSRNRLASDGVVKLRPHSTLAAESRQWTKLSVAGHMIVPEMTAPINDWNWPLYTRKIPPIVHSWRSCTCYHRPLTDNTEGVSDYVFKVPLHILNWVINVTVPWLCVRYYIGSIPDIRPSAKHEELYSIDLIQLFHAYKHST